MNLLRHPSNRAILHQLASWLLFLFGITIDRRWAGQTGRFALPGPGAPCELPCAEKRPGKSGRLGQESGAVLLEVVLALILFVAAAAVISGGINSSLTAVERAKDSTHAMNLAVSVLSELQLGIRTVDVLGPEPFEEPFENWTWEIVPTSQDTVSDEESPLTQVEVIIRRQTPDLTFRLSQMIRPGTASEITPSEESRIESEF